MAGDSRKAYVSIYDTAANSVSELIVDLVGGAVESASEVRGARPAINVDEFLICAETVPQHPDFIAAMAKRGVTDLSNIQVDPFSAGNFGFEDEQGHRLLTARTYVCVREITPYLFAWQSLSTGVFPGSPSKATGREAESLTNPSAVTSA